MARKPKKGGGTGKGGKRGGGPRQPFAALPPALDIRKVGRPSKYDPSFCELVLDMGAAGKSKAQMAHAIGISRQTLDNWTVAHPEFLDAVKTAGDWALAWWQTVGVNNLTRMGFNGTVYIWEMKNRFHADYKDRHTVEGDPDRPFVHTITRRIVDPALPKPSRGG